MPRLVWQPILSGPEADRAAATIAHISTKLAACHPVSFDLARGAAGLALLDATLAESASSHEIASRAMDRMKLAVALADAAGMGALDASLFQGLAGLGFAAAQLGLRELDDLCFQVDDALCTLLDAPWSGGFDLIGGVVGIGVYAVERHRADVRTDLPRLVLEHLRHSLEPFACGAPGMGDLDLGVAHGLAGVIGLLATYVELQVHVDVARALLESATAALLAHRLQAGGFPALVSAKEPPRPTRLAWCYGDAGTALVLYRAGAASNRGDWMDVGLQTARLAAQRMSTQTGVTDAGLCHGAAGLAHIFDRFYQRTGEGCFRNAAVRWYSSALDLESSVDGFLEGAAGTALALSSAIAPVEPKWDRALLLS